LAIDLHIHSTASDGTESPARLPELAASAQLTAVALTDHDTVAGLPEFLARQADFPDIELISGVELSSRYGARELHIVGLFIDPEHPALQKFMESMRTERMVRAEAMQHKLHALGYDISWDDLARAGMTGDVPGRPHFARAMVHKYNFHDVRTVFEQLLKRGCAGYVPRNLPHPAEAIQVIKAAGGVAVWAHLFCVKHNENNAIRNLLRELKTAGLDAIEAYYSEYNQTKTETALRMAKEFSLAVSGGSDFHGFIHPDVKLGTGHGNLQVPDGVLDGLKRTLEPKVLLV